MTDIREITIKVNLEEGADDVIVQGIKGKLKPIIKDWVKAWVKDWVKAWLPDWFPQLKE